VARGKSDPRDRALLGAAVNSDAPGRTDHGRLKWLLLSVNGAKKSALVLPTRWHRQNRRKSFERNANASAREHEFPDHRKAGGGGELIRKDIGKCSRTSYQVFPRGGGG